MKTVAVLHTTPVTITGLSIHFATELPGVKQTNFLDDTMLPEINAAGCITPAVRYRFYNLLSAAAASHPDAILCACSSVGDLLEEGAGIISVPVQRIDAPMAETAIRLGNRIAVFATLASTLGPTINLIERKAKEACKAVTSTPFLIDGAGQLLSEGRMEEYEHLIASQLAQALMENDLIVLAQASMANAVKRLDNWENLPILSSPQSGVAALRRILNMDITKEQ